MTRYFEDFEVGQVFESPGRTITEADIVNYAGLSGNFASIHLNAEKMKDSPFGGRLAFGNLILDVMEGLRMQSEVGRDFEEAVVAFYGFDKVRFLKPVMIGDTITNVMEIAETEERDADTGMVTIEERAVNQDGETVVVCLNKQILEKRPDGE